MYVNMRIYKKHTRVHGLKVKFFFYYYLILNTFKSKGNLIRVKKKKQLLLNKQ